MLMQELELHSRQRLGTSHQDGILVWGHFDRDGGRGSRLGAPLLLLIAASLEAIKVRKPRRNKTSALQSAVRPVRPWAEELRWLNKKRAGCCRAGVTNNVNVTPSEHASKGSHKARKAKLWAGAEEAGDGHGREAARTQGRGSCQAGKLAAGLFSTIA